MEILVALGNEVITNKIREEYKNIVYEHDIDTKENVLEFLVNTDKEYILLTRDNLQGDLNKITYINQIRAIRNKIKIIYIVENLDEEYKKFLFANEVFNIIEGNSIDFKNIKECIDEDNKVIYKEKFINKKQNNKINIQTQFLSKQIIAVYGTSGSGKSTVSSVIAKKISKQLKISVALLDMDIQNPAIDIINNVNGNPCSLSQMLDDIDQNNEIKKIASKYMIKDKHNKKLWYMTNNSSLFDCHNRLSNKYYEKIYKEIYNKYEYSIIDLPSSPFVDVVPYTLGISNKIFFVINANYISIRQAIKYIDLITKIWDNDNGKIYIIVNKIQKNSLDIRQIESLLGGYKIVAVIENNKNMESYINGATSDIKCNFIIDEVFGCLGITGCQKSNSLFKKYIAGGCVNVNKSF